MRATSIRNVMIGASVATAAAFLVLTAITLDDIAARTNDDELRTHPEIVEGKRVWQAYACVDCHTILGNGAYFAPDLTTVHKTRGPQWLAAWMADPVAVNPKSRMPNVRMTSGDIDTLIAYLEWVSRIDTNQWPPEPRGRSTGRGDGEVPAGSGTGAPPSAASAANGQQLFEARGCSGCHSVDGQGATFGPDLATVGATRDREWLDAKLVDPKASNPGSFMPTPDLSDSERADVVEYLTTLR